jgi:hypothetical protein
LSISLYQALPGVPEPAFFFGYNDPRAKAGHQGVLAEIILDLQPFSMVSRPGYLMARRLRDPQYKVASQEFYTGLVDKVCNVMSPCG